MSIMRCEIHDLPWDSDYLENCPRCESIDIKYIKCPRCKEELGDCEPDGCRDPDCPLLD